MRTITAIIIDDEAHNRFILKTLLNAHCPIVAIIDEAENADEAYQLILSKKPELVFLDVRMPNKTGFDLLKQFNKLDFEVIFVSAFNEYAITAFDFNALAYILKPIDYSKLIPAVEKAALKIRLNEKNENLFLFIQSLEEKNDLINKIHVHHRGEVVFLNLNEIMVIEAKGDFVEIKLENGANYYSTKDLKQYEQLLHEHQHFLRVNKSILLNANYIQSYTKGEECSIKLKNGNVYEVSRRKKTEITGKLKNF